MFRIPTGQAPQVSSGVEPGPVRAQIRRIERREWWLWSLTVTVTLLLTAAIASFLVPGLHLKADSFYSFNLSQAVRGLAALVLLFNIYTVYLQLQIQQMRRQLHHREEFFRLIGENAADMITLVDTQGQRLYSSPAYQRILGYSRAELAATSEYERIHPDDRPRVIEAVKKARCTGLGGRLEYRVRHKDGDWRVLESTASVVRNSKGETEKLVIVSHDITERRQAEEALRDAEQKYRGMFEEAVLGIWQTTSDGDYLTTNPAMARMFGYDSPQELIAAFKDLGQQVYVDLSRYQDFIRLADTQGLVQDFELQMYRRDGTKMWLSANAKAVRSNGVVMRYEGTFEDIGDRKLLQEQVQLLAYYDALTGLPNRALLQDRLSKALASARRRQDKVALLFLDIDRFKTINDSLGHSVGDLLLKELAERLKNWAREQDTVARLGGDEFVVVLTAVKEVADAAVAANRIMNAITPEFVIQGHTFTVSCSIGISMFPDHGTDGEAMLKNADAAMYCAKDSGRNNFQFFTHDMNFEAMERLNLESCLRVALKEKEFFLLYQPQVDIVTGNVTGVEALLRWRHPELGLVPPDKFIPIAEKNGLMSRIGQWVLETACAQARQWQEQGLPKMPVAVNVSAVQFRQGCFLQVVRRVLDETGLLPQYLELELTESLLVSNGDFTLLVLQELERMGVRLSIDDFGTGYSSLSYLKNLPVYKLKIDHSFVQAITTDPDDAAITSAIISMAKNLNLKVIAEGVENEDQLFFLRAHNCDELQGYYFSKPLTPEDFATKVRSASLLRPDLQTGMPVIKVQLAREALWYSIQNNSITMELLFLKDKRLIDRLLTTKNENRQKISEIMAKLEIQINSPEEKLLFAAIKDARTPYVDSYDRMLHLLTREKQREAARAVMLRETTPAFFNYQDTWNMFVRLQMEQLAQDKHSACMEAPERPQGSPKSYTRCGECGGSGNNSGSTRCARCNGAGRVPVWTTGQRRFMRYLTNIPICVRAGERDIEGYCNQIAEGGLGALLRELVPVGSVVSLQFVVPIHATKLHLQAVVRYEIGLQHGLEFVSVNDLERFTIRQFCNELRLASPEGTSPRLATPCPADTAYASE